MRRIIILATMLLACLAGAEGKTRKASHRDALRDSVLQLIYAYAQTVDTTGMYAQPSYLYTRFQLRTNKRNASLMLVPTMYALAKSSGRNFFSEYYYRVDRHPGEETEYRRLLNVSTLPRRRTILPSALRFLHPNVYDECLFKGNILSPFHRKNHKYYTYRIVPLPYGKAQIFAFPKIKNTQTVTAQALVNTATGKVYMTDIEGEYDMTRFYISIVMGQEGYRTLLPKRCSLRASFRLLGNDISGFYSSYYDLPKTISDSLSGQADTALMARVRPVPLSPPEQGALDKYYAEKALRDSAAQSQQKQQKTDFVKDVLWDIVGDNVLNRISGGIGKNRQGYYRINPILNPLYMEYSPTKGFVYKFQARGGYRFSDQLQLSLRLKAGYVFKQRRFYYQLPLTLNYNQCHNGYIKAEIGNGNRISTDVIARHILGYAAEKDTMPPMPEGKKTGYTDFRDNYLRLTNHWDFNERWGCEIGFISHYRKAINPEFYQLNGYPTSYSSVAPTLAIEWRPTGRSGPVIKLDYEKAIKGIAGSNIDYERWELDAQTILRMSKRQSFSLRAGAGCYTAKGDHWYFIDYTNFRDTNLPGGWGDNWSGRFELLKASWYNSSPYYVRTNLTYEAPMLLAAWTPLLGRFIERERLYVNTLFVNHLHPYSEWGYGFTTRAFSIGIFAAVRNAEFDGVGCRFGFELFNDW